MITEEQAIKLAAALMSSRDLRYPVDLEAPSVRFVNAMADPDGIFVKYPHMYVKRNDYWEVTFPHREAHPRGNFGITVCVDVVTKEPEILQHY